MKHLFKKMIAVLLVVFTATTFVPVSAAVTGNTDIVTVSRYSNSTTAYYTSGGACFHSSSRCSNMRSPIKSTVGEAKSIGKRACSKCWSGSYTKASVSSTKKKNPTLEKSGATIKVGETVTIKANTNGKVTFSSKSKKIATVTKKGKVKGKKVGKTTIYVKCKSTKTYKNKTLKFKVNVTK